ncbi:hypothetical protein K501DRAFT_322001 [Backusella circina FSU 941]|nr:hypothetical protein K501DRAFT_322001 [Backusella circina FSU 941]
MSSDSEDFMYDSDLASAMSDTESEVFDYEQADEDIGGEEFLENTEKKAYQVDYKVLNNNQLQTKQNNEINHVSAILGLDASIVSSLLRYFHWNKEKLLESYMDAPERVMKQAGIPMVTTVDPTQFIKVKDIAYNFMCDICCDDDLELETVGLSLCGHRFCRDCYTYYVSQKIQEEGESRRIQCPQSNCAIVVDERTVEMLVSEEAMNKYRDLLNRTFVDDNSLLKWCPAPDCEYAVECNVPKSSLTTVVPTVQCECSSRFCFGCGLYDHQPCVCGLIEKWMKKCKDDSETANWISAHTKECPKCKSTIEKNGGCNHMTCRKCRHEFCWVCMGPWSEHGSAWYSCNRYSETHGWDNTDERSQSRAMLERYLHYYNRYSNHEQSAKLDQELYQKTEKKMEDMQQNSDLSWIEVQFLKKAVDVTVQCRTTLKWTYAFAFYLDKSNHTELFEDNQRDLEMATEQLSELLEKKIEPESIAELRQIVLDKSVYVKSRRELLLEDTAKGLQENRWTFKI